MEEISKEQAIVNQMAMNFANKMAQLESEKAILQVENQILKQQLEEQKKRGDD